MPPWTSRDEYAADAVADYGRRRTSDETEALKDPNLLCLGEPLNRWLLHIIRLASGDMILADRRD